MRGESTIGLTRERAGISPALVSLVCIAVAGLLSLASEKQSMSGTPERSLLTAGVAVAAAVAAAAAAAAGATQEKRNGTLRRLGASAKRISGERQIKSACLPSVKQKMLDRLAAVSAGRYLAQK